MLEICRWDTDFLGYDGENWASIAKRANFNVWDELDKRARNYANGFDCTECRVHPLISSSRETCLNPNHSAESFPPV